MGNGRRTLLIIPGLATLAFLVYFAGEAALHVLPTGLSPFRRALSQYAIGPYARLSRAASLANVVGVALLAAALTLMVGSPPLARAGLAALVVVALARVAAGFSPMDAPGRRSTRSGRVHLLLAAVNFGAAVVALRALTGDLRRLPAWHGVLPVLAVAARLSLPLLILVGLTFAVPPLRRVFGLAERLFMLAVNGWLLVVAAFLSLRGAGMA